MMTGTTAPGCPSGCAAWSNQPADPPGFPESRSGTGTDKPVPGWSITMDWYEFIGGGPRDYRTNIGSSTWPEGTSLEAIVRMAGQGWPGADAEAACLDLNATETVSPGHHRTMAIDNIGDRIRHGCLPTWAEGLW